MLGDRIVSLRNTRKMTQKSLADALGVTDAAVGMWERNKRFPDAETLVKIADIFGITVDELLGRTNEPVTVPPWMKKLRPETRERLEAVGGLRNFHTRFLGGTSLNDLDQHDLEIIMQVYFRHLEASEKKRKAKEKEDR